MKQKTVHLGIRVSASTKTALIARAKRESRTLSNLVKTILQSALNGG